MGAGKIPEETVDDHALYRSVGGPAPVPSHPEATPPGLLCSRTPAGMLPRRHEGSFSGAAWLLVPGHLVAERVGRRWHGELRATARSVLAEWPGVPLSVAGGC